MMVVKKKRAEEEGIGTPPGRWSCLGSATVRQVWASNLMEMLPVLQGRGESSFVAVDTGFRGFIHHTLRSAGPQERYFDVKRNVDNLELVNVGLTFFSGGGGGARSSWHINLKDDFKDIRLLPSRAAAATATSDFGSTLMYEEFSGRGMMTRKGVDPSLLSALLRGTDWAGTTVASRRPRWVTFHGLYDVAYLVKLLTGGCPLPNTLSAFARLVGETLGIVYDLKYMARLCRCLHGGELSLARLSEIMEVEVDHSATHRSGYDSLLTAMAFEKMMARWHHRLHHEDLFEGALYGIEEERIIPHWRRASTSQEETTGAEDATAVVHHATTTVMMSPPFPFWSSPSLPSHYCCSQPTPGVLVSFHPFGLPPADMAFMHY